MCLLRTVLNSFLLTAAMLALAIMLNAHPAGAAGIGTLRARVDSARIEARSLAGTVQLRNAQFQAAAANAGAAARRLAAVEAELAYGRARVARIERRVADANARLRVAQTRFHREQGKLARRMVAIYKSGSPDIAGLLLGSASFSDLLTRTDYLKKINDADGALVSRVKALRDKVKKALAAVKALHAEAAAQVARLADARSQASKVRAAAAAQRAQAERARAAAQSSLANLRSRISNWTAQVAALQAATGQGGNAGQTVNQWFGDYTIPQSVVMCESGGNYGAVNPTSGAGGAYQMLPDTYKGLGGKYAAPNVAPKWEQDRLAAKLWNGGAGAGNWECAK
jgi:septal ring factor EnvC (AmiA/AmiB activator)